MKIDNYHIALSLTIVLILFVISNSCKKDDKDDADEVEISSRQIYAFSEPDVGFYKSCPTLVNDYLYIGTSAPANVNYQALPQNYFYKLDLSLNKIWQYSLGNKQLRGSASLDGFGNVYFVVDSVIEEGWILPALYSLDNNGNFRWSKYNTPHFLDHEVHLLS